MSYPSNVILLLLQIILQRQQVLSHKDKSLNLQTLLQDPIIDNEVLQQFNSHKLVKLYCPELSSMTRRTLQAMVHDIFQSGFGATSSSPLEEQYANIPITVASLANFYYDKRLNEIQQEELPKLEQQLKDQYQN
ncbi:Swc7p NDAI_0J02200 [Naumovozyma dairenensis CBS 421]|uniref:SWR1-complex protein 7 n=1 Tax=Naumovozyma dairenensis (strain ATCC 10597 / BCRC 20456 / CBS 421 / NBRC 0211 / NRRL Y-12639) TaxID=1071378 RepID=G0WH34_NAUDC|nr:hypothetical protein NDAI_0J02200 [Naumovozyma dairenensis CBS 421]CCD27112.1 hypothetical protein NDAI_0J02200 [Naumovozyma dairenensis CBS 421]